DYRIEFKAERGHSQPVSEALKRAICRGYQYLCPGLHFQPKHLRISALKNAEARAGIKLGVNLHDVCAVRQLHRDSNADLCGVVGVLCKEGKSVCHRRHHPANGSSSGGSTRVTNGRSSPAARAASYTVRPSGPLLRSWSPRTATHCPAYAERCFS